jgi:polysaccharide biosynthesis protein PslG
VRGATRGARFSGRLAGAIVLAVAAGVAAVAPGAGAAPVPRVGVVADITWGIPPADITRTVTAMTSAGVGWVRASVSWSGIEPDAKGVLNQGYLADVDAAVVKARDAGLQVLMPLADGVPYWASADPAKYQDGSGSHWNKYWRSTRTSDYADFVKAMVTRYSALGVHTFELGNEPNTDRFWPSGPNPAEFVTFLAAAYPAAKAANPGATLLMGGLSKSDYDFLAQMYTAGGRPYFDAVAIHPYTGSVDPTWCWNQAGTTKLAKDAFCAIEEVRNTMVAAGDSAKPIWLTEFGWSTTTAAYGVSEAAQADFLTKAFAKLQSYPYVAAAFWYNFRNNWWSEDAPADYEANLGLLRTDFTPKPAYDAMRSVTGGATATTTTTTAAVDQQGPVVSDVRAVAVDATSASITWVTNELSDSRVEYWASSTTKAVTDAARETSHSIQLSGLSPWTRYSYRIRSADPAGNVTVSPNYSFRTAR